MDKHGYYYHYYEKEPGPFMSLSDLSDEAAREVIEKLVEENETLAAKTHGGDYMIYRRRIEKQAYYMFIQKGGKPCRKTPHYMVWGGVSSFAVMV